MKRPFFHARESGRRIPPTIRLMCAVSLVVVVIIGCTSTDVDTGTDTASGPPPQRYVEALPPPEKPVIAVLPVANETGIAQLDTLASTLNETIALNLDLIGEYDVYIAGANGAFESIGEGMLLTPDTPDYLVEGVIERDDRSDLVGNISVTTIESGHIDVLDEPIVSILEVFETADALTGEVVTFFTDESVTVGTVLIDDSEAASEPYRVYVDGQDVGAGLRELTLITGTRRLDIRTGDMLVFADDVLVEKDTSQTFAINSLGSTELRISVVESFVIPAANVSPHGITWDGRSLWIVDENESRLLQVDPTGTLIETFAGPPGYLTGITFDGTDIWVGTFDSNGDAEGGDRGLYRIDRTDGSILSFMKCPGGDLTGLTWDGESFWYGDFSDGGKIRHVTSGGRLIGNFDSPATEPLGMAYADTWARLFNVDNRGSELYMLDRTGTVLDSVLSPTPNPIGLTWDGTDLWLAGRANNRVFRLSLDGTR